MAQGGMVTQLNSKEADKTPEKLLIEYSLQGDVHKLHELIRTEGRSLDVNYKYNGLNALMCAVQNGRGRAILTLLDVDGINHNLRSDNTGDTALLLACRNGSQSIAMLLLRHKECHINLQNQNGSTPLILACDRGHTEIALELINKPEIDVNLQTTSGHTALICKSATYLAHCIASALYRCAS